MAYSLERKTEPRPSSPRGIYLFCGSDAESKAAHLKKIKEQFLPRQLQDFNFDTLYAKEINLKELKERFLAIPLKSEKRIILVKQARYLSSELRSFFIAYSKNPHKELILILDFENLDFKDDFIKGIQAFAQVIRVKEQVEPDTFDLSRQIQLKKTGQALNLLNLLLRGGQPPERILGGLRYGFERQGYSLKRLKLLLACDLEIKTGRIAPAFALEKLVVSLCAFT